MAGIRQTAAAWLAKWKAIFADNEYQNITEKTFRDLQDDTAATFATWEELTTNQVKGSVFRVSHIVIENGVITVPTASIPPRYRILGMEVQATNGTDAATAATGVRADPISFKLLAHSTGTVDALVDEQATTTATVKARWVRTSGTDEQKIATFPVLPLEDVNVYKGEVYQYFFADLVPPVTRLLEIIHDITDFTHPVPTGLDDDPHYKPFAPLSSAVGYNDTPLKAKLANQESRLTALENSPTGAVTTGSGNVIQFVADADYPSPPSGTFTLDMATLTPGVTVRAFLSVGRAAVDVSAPLLQRMTATSHDSARENIYCFAVGTNGKVQYWINQPL